MMKLGVTGGIGSGKSFVCNILRDEFGIPVYDCDVEAKRLLNESLSLRMKMLALVGPEVYGKDGTLDKAQLASFLFASASNAQKVNAIVHPEVRKDFRRWAKEQHSEVVGLESAILFDSGFDTEVDRILFVDAPLHVRISRAMNRDQSSEAKVRERIALQDIESAREKANWIIQNTEGTTKQNIIKQIKELELC